MIKIRKFSLSDLEEVMKIGRTSFPKNKTYSEDYFQKCYQKYPEGFIVAENKGKIVGYAISQLKRGISIRRIGKFISLAVKPEFRQKGVGKKLVNSLINNFKKKVKEISLTMRTKNKIAISFYQNLGFKIIKKIENYYRNNDDAYIMKKEI